MYHCIPYRKFKAVSTLALNNLIATHLASDPPINMVDTLVNHYNAAVSSSLNCLVPHKTRAASFTFPASWFTSHLCDLKTTGHRLERLYKRSDLTVHLEAYKDHVRSY